MQLPILEVLERNFSLCSSEYKQFALQKDGCKACSIYDHYKQIIQSEGNAKDPLIMIIGEAPGRDEVEQVRPFIGQAGQLLRETLKKHRDIFNKHTTFITNVIACRPLDNKFPTSTEPQLCCDSWLFKEIAMLKPRVIVCLGNTPLKYVMQETGITKQRGKWKQMDRYNARAFATFHPSYVMRAQRSKDQSTVDTFEKDFADLAIECRKLLQVKQD